MPEAEAPRQRPVRPFLHPVGLQELAAPRQVGTLRLDGLALGLEARRHRRLGARHPGHTGGLYDALLPGTEGGEAVRNQFPQALRHAHLHPGQPLRQLPAPPNLLQHPLLHQRVRDGDQEERMAAGAAVQGRRQPGR